MKIVYYNWVDHDDPEKRGGGVSTYQANIASQTKSDKCFFISSGTKYDLFGRRVRLECKGNKFFIYNSHTLAPSHASFSSPEQISDPETAEVFMQAIRAIGSPDIVHFNNFEGIPISALALLKQEFPETKIIFSVHNYYPICPQVNLWNREKANCSDYKEGRACINCINQVSRPNTIKNAYALSDALYSIGLVNSAPLFSRIWSIVTKIHSGAHRVRRIFNPDKAPPDITNFSDSAEFFRVRRGAFIDMINQHVDLVLAVSERVREICVEYGFNSAKVRTSYIGTKHAQQFRGALRKASAIGSIGYFGYMRRDKGFYFLLRALRKLPESVTKDLELVIAARDTDHGAVWQIRDLTQKFAKVVYANGYTSKSLPSLLSQTDLVIVPSLWEDNLPQVAIEANCYNVALFCSDKGGASEVTGRNPAFTFKAGDMSEFSDKLVKLVHAGVTSDYWDGAMTPISMEDHMTELKSIYSAMVAQTIRRSEQHEPSSV